MRTGQHKVDIHNYIIMYANSWITSYYSNTSVFLLFKVSVVIKQTRC